MLGVKVVWFIIAFLVFSITYGLFCKKIFPNVVNSKLHVVAYGTIAFWAMFYVISVPMIFAKCSMNLFTIVMCGVTGLCLLVDVWDFMKVECFIKGEHTKATYKIIEVLMFFVLCTLIGLQIYAYVFLQHTDADDAEFVVFATSAIQNNEMLTVDPYTGEQIWNALFVKRAMNPFVILIAFYSKVTGIHPAIMSHTVIPPVLVLLAYLIYWMIAEKIFKTRKERLLFLIFIAVIHIYGYTSVYTNSAFFLLRLWQGKAVLASLIIPFISCACFGYSDEKRKETIRSLVVLGLAGTLTSGISYVVIPIEIMAYFLAQAIVKKRISIILDGLIACMPSLVCGGMFFVLMYLAGVV